MFLNEQEYFVILSQEKNFTRAAEMACISQPALSKAIAKLERDYGCALVVREGKTVSLTVAGQLYLESARRMLRIREEGYAKIHSMERKTQARLRIGINRQYTQRRFAQALKKNYRNCPGPLPDVYELDSRQGLNMLRAGLLDMAVALQDEASLPEDLVRYPLTAEVLAAYLPDTPEFQPILERYSCGEQLPIRELDGMTALHTAAGSNFDEILQGYFRRQKVTPNYVCLIFEVLTAVEAVKNGMGMTFNYLSRADQFRCPHYYEIVPSPALRHYIFLRPDTEETDQIRFLIDLLRKNVEDYQFQ